MRSTVRILQAAFVAASATRPTAAQQVQAAQVAPVPAASVRAAPLLLDSARAALRAGQTEPAVRMAEQYTSRNYRDPRGYVVLGNAYFTRMPAGRFQALRAYEEAQRLAPNDPEPAYLYAQVGIWLGGDEGEQIARRGLEKVLDLDPFYGMAWTQWLLAFRNNESRRRVRERLAGHDRAAEVRARIAYLAIEDEQYGTADSMLSELLASDSTNVEWLAWRSQSAFEAGDTTGGTAFYVRALTHADRDSTETLWRQAIGIAGPDEIRAWDGVPPERRGAWLATFWARRSGSLFAGTNTRLAEHFRRLRYARKNYPLQRPLVTYHRSRIAGALNLEPARGERDFYQRCEMYQVIVPPSPLARRPLIGDAATPHHAGADGYEARAGGVGFFDRTIFAPLDTDLRGIDPAAARIGYNLATGLDDRGVLYLRFGAPQALAIGGNNPADGQCATPDLERWHYDEIGDVRFARPSAFSRGERTVSEMVFRPMNAPQSDAMRAGLTRDAPAEPATLDFGIWTAQFAGGRPGAAEIAVISTRGALAATLVSEDGVDDVRRSAAGWVILEADPGSYTLLAHARDSLALGRQELSVEARLFALPSLSDLLLAPAWATARPTRYDMLRRIARTLTFAEGTTLRSYAELYGLVPDGAVVRYRAAYALRRTDDAAADLGRDAWPDAVRLAFDRESPLVASGITREVLDITPERLAPGRYVLRLKVWDLVGGKGAGSSQIVFTVR